MTFEQAKNKHVELMTERSIAERKVMNQITPDELLARWIEQSEHGFERVYDIEELHLETEDYLLKQKPTLEELDKDWDHAGYKMTVLNNGVIHIYDKYAVKGSDPTFAFSVYGDRMDGLISGKTFHYLIEVNALVSTFKYLQNTKNESM